MTSLQDLFAMQENRTEKTILPEAAIDRLREAFPRYVRSCPFKVGDLVMAAQGSVVVHPGRPEVVIATREDAAFDFNAGDPGSNSYGTRFDMRIIAIINDCVIPVWVESSQYVPYEAAAEIPADTAEAA